MPTLLVTGAGRGFGREIVSVFLERGWIVFPLVRDPSAARQMAGPGGVSCHPIVADVTEAAAGDRISAALADHDAALDLLINNAGIIRKRRGLMDAAAEDMEDLFRVHCVGALRCTRAALPFLRKAPAPIVVNVTSRWGSIARTVAGQGGGIYSYQIAKCAQNMLTACLDHELAPQGIRVFAVHPGRLLTEAAAADADTTPREAAARLADWIGSVDRRTVCGCHDLGTGGLIEW